MAEYACKCLNIRIRAQPTGGSPPVVQGGEFVPVHVGDQGISAVHPELTLRSRTRAKSSADSNMLRRHICLTCLNCSSLVYRIEHIEPANMEGGEGPVLPTDEWAEHEVLRTSSGWIELSKGCLDQESIAKAAASKSYSPLFRVILPSPTITEMLPSNTPSTSTPKPANPSEALHTCLPPLSPLFPPPPFTPSHPTFSHLSSLATDQSQKIRQAAEDYLAEITRVKVAEIERQEDDLRRQVQLLWAHFRESLAPFEQEKKELRRVHAHPHSTSEWSQSGAPAGHGTPVSVHDFVPVASPSRLRSASPPIPRVHSALSASLVTTSMHPPRAAQQSETRSEISSHPSETLAEAPEFIDPATSLREAYRRDVDEEKDIATSLKYVFNMEEAGAAVRGRQGRRNSASDSRSPEGAVKPTPGDFAKSPTRMEPIAEASGSGTVMATSPKAEEHVQEAPSPGKSKGKRKVTFDIKPDIAPSAEEASAAQQNGVEEAIFDLDQETADRPENEDPNAVKLSLPLLEPPHMPARPAHRRSTSGSSLPPHLSSLRPASLPAPSNMRVVLPPPPQAPAPAPSKANGDSASAVESKKPEEEPLSPREAELLRLVAADVPSHRNGWKRDSKAWQTFVTRQGGKSKYPAALSFDEEEEDDENGVLENGEDKSGVSSLSSRNGTDFGVLAASLPISIHPQAVRRHSASVLSYQPKTSLTDHYGSLVPPLPLADGTRYGTSSAAIRKAAYAERDRGRSLDPGALDFATDDDDEKSDNEEGPGRGRNHALKILQARSELPPEGMWRSLAT